MSKCQNTWGRGREAVLVFPAGTSRVLKTDAKAILLKVPSSSFQRVTGPTSWDRRPNFPTPVRTPKPCTSSRAALPAPQRTMKKQKERGGIYVWIYVRCIHSMLLWLLTGNPPFATPFYLLILARQHENLRTREQTDRQGTVPTLPQPRRGWVLAGHGHRHPGDSEAGAGVSSTRNVN